MDASHRARSSSATRLGINQSPSPHAKFDPAAQSLDPALQQDTTQSQQLHNAVSSYQDSDFASQAQDLYATSAHNQQGAFGEQDLSLSSFDQVGLADQSLLQYTSSQSFNVNKSFDDSVFLDFDPGLVDTTQTDMTTLHQQSPDAPHLLQPGGHNSARSSPALYQGPYSPPSQHNRNASLDPSSAAHPQGAEWQAYRHRRTPSDQGSVVSSNHPSPYMGNADSFEPMAGGPSPMLNGAQDPSVFGPDALGLGHFSLSDGPYISPNHSAHPSPYIAPQQPLFDQSDAMITLNQEQFNVRGSGLLPAEPFPSLQHNEIGQADQMSPPEIRFDPAPPSKQPSYADLSEYRGPEQNGGLGLPDHGRQRRAISDPHSVGSRNHSPARPRSPSDGLHPASSLSARARSQSPSGSPAGIRKDYRRSSSPAIPSSYAEVYAAAAGLSSRASPVPSDAEDGSPGSTSGLENTSPSPSGLSRSPSNSGTKRAQKHPANFQCHLCPKRFTRAYNLRSHLRTHTDERPFVCTICGKAFARQHDRKRHEGLHSGEKKFVCKGTLTGPENQNLGSWGCGRRFARADALGRHFRSEAGRACIRPLLDEEARQRQVDAAEQAYNRQMQSHGQPHLGGQPSPEAMMGQPMMGIGIDGSAQVPIDYSAIPLPAALLEQFPALRDIQWNAPPGHTPSGGAGGVGSDYDDYDDGNISGRSSFDAGTDMDYYEDELDGPAERNGQLAYEQQSQAQSQGLWTR